MAAAISFSTEFLAPPTGTVPDSGPPARTTMRSTGCQYGRTMATIRATWPGDGGRSPDAVPTPRRHRARGRGRARSVRPRRGPVPRYRRTCRTTATARSETTSLPAGHPLVRLAVRPARAPRLKRPPSTARAAAGRGGRRPTASTPGRPPCSACSRRRRSRPATEHAVHPDDHLRRRRVRRLRHAPRAWPAPSCAAASSSPSACSSLADREGRRRMLVVSRGRGAGARRGWARWRRRSCGSPPRRRSAARSASPSAARRHRGRRGDAAGSRGLRHQRGGHGGRARRRAVRRGRCRWPTSATRGWRLVYVVPLVFLVVAWTCGGGCPRPAGSRRRTPSGRRCRGAASSCSPRRGSSSTSSWRRSRSSTTAT